MIARALGCKKNQKGGCFHFDGCDKGCHMMFDVLDVIRNVFDVMVNVFDVMVNFCD